MAYDMACPAGSAGPVKHGVIFKSAAEVGISSGPGLQDDTWTIFSSAAAVGVSSSGETADCAVVPGTGVLLSRWGAGRSPPLKGRLRGDGGRCSDE
jgi:hypothetical protein